MADGVFTFKGKQRSSDLPEIVMDGKAIERAEFHQRVVAREVGKLSPMPTGTKAYYVATGSGYGSNEMLMTHEIEQKKLEGVTVIKGETFRALPEFEKEKDAVREAIRAHFGEEAIKAKPEIIETTLRTFYSNEVNTVIGKTIVIEGIKQHKSVGYDSASLYTDTLERLELAQGEKARTILIAGDMKLEEALKKQASATNRYNTAASYKIFATRFAELAGKFDEVRVYNTDTKDKDGKVQPILIAEKTGAGQELKIHNPALYVQFLAKAETNVQQYTQDPEFKANATSIELGKIIKEQEDAARQKKGGVPNLPSIPQKQQER